MIIDQEEEMVSQNLYDVWFSVRVNEDGKCEVFPSEWTYEASDLLPS